MKTLIALTAAIFIANVSPAYADCDTSNQVMCNSKQDLAVWEHLDTITPFADQKAIDKKINQEIKKYRVKEKKTAMDKYCPGWCCPSPNANKFSTGFDYGRVMQYCLDHPQATKPPQWQHEAEDFQRQHEDAEFFADISEYPLYADSNRVQKMIDSDSDKADIEQ
jgi:hypothetical protein